MPSPDTAQHHPLTFAQLRRRYFGPLLAGLLLLRLATMVLWLAAMIPWHHDISFPEGALVARALDVAHGLSPYHDWRLWPHAFAPYPPLTYYPVGWLTRLLSPALAVHDAYVIGRTLSFLSLMGIFVLIYLFARRLGLTRLWSLLAIALLAEFQMLLEYCVSYRPDAPKTFFAFLALWLALRLSPWPGHPAPDPTGHDAAPAPMKFALRLAAPLSALYLSLWIKPTAWALCLVLGVWLWRALGFRRALAAGLLFAASGLLPFCLLDRHLHGLLWLNLVDSLRNGLSLQGLRMMLKPAHLEVWLILLAGVAAALAAWRRPESAPHRPLLAAALLALPLNLLQMLKAGGDLNYLLESYPLCALLAVYGVARLWRGESRLPAPLREGLLWGGAVPVMLIAAWMNFSTLGTDMNFKGSVLNWRPTRLELAAARLRRPILATHPYASLFTGEPTLLDYVQYTILCRRGALDSRPLRERLEKRQFPMILLVPGLVDDAREGGPESEALYFKGFLPLLEAHYAPSANQDPHSPFRIWLPK